MIYYTAKRELLPSSPNEYYREHMQQLINSHWDNTTRLQTIEEEYPFGSLEFREVEVNMLQLVFQDIDYLVNLGNYYRFSNAYWLTINLDELNRTTKNIIVRRCNNFLRWKNSSGDIYEYPCVLEYDATAASPRVDNNIITPNNRIRVIVQANKDTLTLKVNHRFIFSEESQEDDTPEVLNGIVIDPAFDTVRQNYTVNFEANLYIDGVKQSDEIFASTSGAPDWTYEFNSLGNNMFSVRCKKVAQIPLMITLTNGIVSQNVIVDLASMF